MKKVISILVLATVLIGCGNSEVESAQSKKMVRVDAQEESVTGGFNAKIAEAPLSNPAFMYGSDFLTFFKSLRKMGKYDDMIKFTSSSSVEKYGREKVKKFYSKKYKNVSKVKLTNKETNEDGSITLFYTNINMATKNAIDITVVIENDTAKIVLSEELNKFPN